MTKKATSDFEPTFYRAHNNYDTKLVSDFHSVENHEPSMTVQSQAEDADINVIMKRYGLTGKMPANPRLPSYDDYSTIRDFTDAMQVVLDAADAFNQYPAEFRNRFQNDPQKFLEFATNENNRPEMEFLGLLRPKETPQAGPTGPTPPGEAGKPSGGTESNTGGDSPPPKPAKGGTT